VCWAANMASAAGMYAFARRHGTPFFREGWGRKLLPPEAIAALQHAYDRHGVVGIFLSRFLPGLRAGVTPFAGVVGMPPARVLVPAGLASAIWYAFLIAAGSALGRNWDAVKTVVGDANRVLAIVAVAATIALALWVWRRVRRARAE
jgi:membrane-associated protein